MIANLTKLREIYRCELLDHVMPFWTRYAIDDDGSINTCVQDDGNIISRDRWGWSQWRALWVFSKLFNCIERRTEWLEIAHGIYRRLMFYGQLPNGHWPLLVDEAGIARRGYESLYTDGFAIYALVEYWRATSDDEALAVADRTFESAVIALDSDEPPPTWPYPTPNGYTPHGLSMLFSLAFFELAQATAEEKHLAEALKHHQFVMTRFLQPKTGFVLEWLKRDHSSCASPLGTAVCPGHAIESMWFQIHIARTAPSAGTIEQAISAICFHLERGWDEEHGGLFLAIDSTGRSEIEWPHANTKLWWPHTESLYATLLAYECCEEAWCLEWHQKVHDYCFARFRQPQYGEWTQKLDRYGNVIPSTLFLPVKDPFHLPRALIYCIELLERHCMNVENESIARAS